MQNIGQRSHQELQSLIAAVQVEALVLTPNLRLARQLTQQLESVFAAGDMGSWPTPRIMAIDSWLQGLWLRQAQLGRNAPLGLLSRQHETYLWQQVVEKSSSGRSLMRPDAAASLAQQAYQLLANCMLKPAELHAAVLGHPDGEALLDWCRDFRRQARRRQVIALVDVAQHLLENAAGVPKENAIVLAGFTSPTPLQMALLQSVTDNLSEFRWTASPQHLGALSCKNSADEIYQAASWARGRLEREPACRIGIVLPDLAAQCLQVEQILSYVFKADAMLPGVSPWLDDYDLSASYPLTHAPLVASALLSIRALYEPLSQDEWLALLTSPYVGCGTAWTPLAGGLLRALYDAAQRTLDFPSLLRGFERQHDYSVAQKNFIERLMTARRQLLQRQRGARLLPSDWVAVFEEIFQIWQLASQRQLDSNEYQQLQVFKQATAELANYNIFSEPMRLGSAFGLLRQHLDGQIYHRENKQARIQVLGTLEASGQVFDYLWIAGMGDRQWPTVPRPNPLLPRALQIARQMPNASVEREFEYTKKLTQGFLQGARKQVVVSFPATIDEVACQLSPLLASLAEFEPLAATAAPMLYRELAATSAHCLANYSDDYGSTPAAGVMSGGSQLLADQARCPFKAHSRFRLDIESLRLPGEGLTAAEQGSLVHRALEYIWEKLPGIEDLHLLSAQEQSQLVMHAIDSAFGALLLRRDKPLLPRLQALEQQRLNQLLAEWLELEKQRPPFTVVAREHLQQYTLNDLTVQLRLDRCDALQGGGQVLLDYKTGDTSTGGWFSERLLEPQLPLYALAAGRQSEVTAIAYSRLKPGALAFQGVSADDLGIDGVVSLAHSRAAKLSSWPAQLLRWQQQVDVLFHELAAGDARVDPVPGSCQYCGLQPLCRIHAAGSPS